MRGLSRVRLWSDGRVIAAAYAGGTLVATWQKYASGHANNLRIFRASFFNLLAGRDLYSLHPEQHADYFKYSPTFALLMAPFAALPEVTSAIAWNLCNAFALFAVIRFLNFSREQRAVILWLILIELLISVQNFQSNALVGALIIATFIALERGRPELAGVLVALGASIKIIGAAAALFALFHPGKLRFVFTTIVAGLLLFALPLVATSMTQLRWQYGSWLFLLQGDYFAEGKLSVMSWLHAWFGVDWPNSLAQIAGLGVLLLPLFWVDRWSDRLFRLQFLGSLLVFLVLFNHKAESPMFIMAVTGVAIWYVASSRNCRRNFLVALVLVITSLGSTDLMPHYWRERMSTPLALKAFPCILAWLVMQYELLRQKVHSLSSERSRGIP